MKRINLKIALLLSMGTVLIGCGTTSEKTTSETAKNDYQEVYYEEEGEATEAYTEDDYNMSYEKSVAEPVVEEFNTEEYAKLVENQFQDAIVESKSTFSIDVDNASYTNVRRMLEDGYLPTPGAVRIEEFINYFDYSYPIPSKQAPFSMVTEVGECPWNKENRLVHIGLQGYTMPIEELPPSNLVFLLDVSGSMSDANKLPLLKKSFKMMVDKLNEKDRVSIVVYAGAAGVVLEPTSCSNKGRIMEAFDRLEAGGSTAGAEGIEKAYQLAEEQLLPHGNNRVILATDGDFNVGPSSEDELVNLIERKREKGIYLTILGFGMGNYKDARMESISNAGNGNYFYVDDLGEAKNILVDNLAGTLLTIAKDVKIQVEFNPARVSSYRLIGYENRKLENQDFANDKKDAGELGAGHTVTALYEIVPNNGSVKSDYKYVETKITDQAKKSNELLTVRFRYKKPDANKSTLLEKVVLDSNRDWEETSGNFKFSAGVAAFGMLLRQSEYANNYTYNELEGLLNSAVRYESDAKKLELLLLVNKAKSLTEVSYNY